MRLSTAIIATVVLAFTALVAASLPVADRDECSPTDLITIGSVLVLAGCPELTKRAPVEPPSEFAKELRQYSIYAGRSF